MLVTTCKTGATVELGFDLNKAHFFDVETEKQFTKINKLKTLLEIWQCFLRLRRKTLHVLGELIYYSAACCQRFASI